MSFYVPFKWSGIPIQIGNQDQDQDQDRYHGEEDRKEERAELLAKDIADDDEHIPSWNLFLSVFTKSQKYKANCNSF